MPANNIRLLTSATRAALNERYDFEFDSNANTVTVCMKTCKRRTMHDAAKPFYINCKVNPKRRLMFTTQAITLWQQMSERKYSLIDIQNAVNILRVTMMDVNLDNVIKTLHKY